MECAPGDSDRIMREAYEVVDYGVSPVGDGWVAVISVRVTPGRDPEELIHKSATEERAQAWLERKLALRLREGEGG